MDAKPQRPIRGVRVRGDENVPPAVTGTKTLHHRNKSSPALSTMLHAGGLKAAAKRTAFGEVTNTVNNLRPSRDDSVISGKAGYEITDKALLLQEHKKAAALQKPAQRPVSVTGLRGLLANASNASHISVPAKPSTDAVQPTSQLANTRKVLTKKNTAIFKDTSALANELDSVTQQDNQVPAPTVTLNHSVIPEQQVQIQQYVEPIQPKVRRTLSRYAINSTETQVDPNKGSEVSASVAHSRGVYLDTDRCVQFRHYADEDEEELNPEDYYDNGVEVSQEIKTVLDNEAVSTKMAEKHIARPVSELEEYWDEEEDEEHYEEDGYVTAQSYRSRGDNTTGAVTTVLVPKMNQKIKRELAAATQLVEASRTADEIEDESWDTSMVAEYGDEIFQYMRELEVKMSPNPHYMDNQAEIQWSMRAVLMDWLVQVHHRFGLLPETLFLCVNYIDRFLSCKIVSLGKLQLVGATAIFVAAKYEEINCPSVQEIVYMVDGGYAVDEILKAERFMLSMLQFELGWPGPMSFLRRISKADDYDLESRTLAKYFLEITIMDERFVGSPPSFLAAGAHCLARMMLRKGVWSPAHVYYSNYTYSQLHGLVSMMVECCENPQKHHAAVYEKYCDKRFKRASMFVASEMKKGFQPLDVTANCSATIAALSETYHGLGRKSQQY